MTQGHMSVALAGVQPLMLKQNFRFVTVVEKTPPAILKRSPPSRGTWTSVVFWALGGGLPARGPQGHQSAVLPWAPP